MSAVLLRTLAVLCEKLVYGGWARLGWVTNVRKLVGWVGLG